MLYVRYTREAGLLEISEDYMKLADEVSTDFGVFLQMIPIVWGPFVIDVEGETRSGGFSTEALIAPAVTPGHVVSDLYVISIDEIVKEVARRKSIGYLRADGVVKHLSEPYKRLYVKVGVPAIGADFTIEWYKRKTAKAYVPEAVARKIIDTLKLFATNPGKVPHTKNYAVIHSGESRTRKYAETLCSIDSYLHRCDFREGKVVLLTEKYRRTYAYVLGDDVPIGRVIGPPCTCVIEKHTENDREIYRYTYAYISPALRELIKKAVSV